MAQRWWEYVQRVTRGATQSEIARRLGLGQTSISRWQRGEPRPENVRAFAKAYNRPVTEAMIAAGYMEPEDVPPTDATDKDDSDDDVFYDDPDLQWLWEQKPIPEEDRRALIAVWRAIKTSRGEIEDEQRATGS